ncbi:hypothetical protein KIN20_009386, partial [Parelaphostrongylus tenuis]
MKAIRWQKKWCFSSIPGSAVFACSLGRGETAVQHPPFPVCSCPMRKRGLADSVVTTVQKAASTFVN